MTDRSVTHGTFAIERSYPAAPDRVFAAFATLEAKSRWFGTPDDTFVGDREFDFRVGGGDRFTSKPEDATYTYDAVYYDIVPGQRIVMAYEMYANDARMSFCVATVEIVPDGTGSQLTYTDQGAYLDDIDKPEWREQGTSELLDKLGEVLAGGSWSASKS
jgi:uncharacterized protein YndB with AHSA1/START domain